MSCSGATLYLPPFPTRRSSDLHPEAALAARGGAHRRLRPGEAAQALLEVGESHAQTARALGVGLDRKSTRLNSSHRCISYVVFCLKKKRNTNSHRFGSSPCYVV